MHIEAFREFCLSLPETEECFPFDANTLVFKVRGMMFTACDINDFQSINVKCNPEMAIELRERYQEVMPGYHMNKKHWNTIDMHGSLSDAFIEEQILNSYNLVKPSKK
jgi:predicted DNA-binding protein (MmcQ/YjbR family)